MACALAALLFGCQSTGTEGPVSSSAPPELSGPAVSAIAGDMVSRLAEQIRPGKATVALKNDASPFEQALEAALRCSSAVRTSNKTGSAPDLYAAALRAGLGGQNVDPNAQGAKEDFFDADLKELGYLPNRVVPQQSPFELKRGSVIPATLITGINSDLPGRITAQVSQSVYDSATGRRLPIPQGTKLFGRYDSKVSFGQKRFQIVWTDIIFPTGSTLQIGGMSWTDAQGHSGSATRSTTII